MSDKKHVTPPPIGLTQVNLILKVWAIFCLLWSIYIYLFGEIRFFKFFPIDHWLIFLPRYMHNIGYSEIGQFFGLIALGIKWGLFIPLVASYLLIKKMYNELPLLNLIMIIIFFAILLYFSVLLIEVTAIYSLQLRIFKSYTKSEYVRFLANFDEVYIWVSFLGSLSAIIEMKFKSWRK